MSLDLANYERKASKAVARFWDTRNAASTKQTQSGKADQGERGGVTAGKNMDGFVDLLVDVVRANGLEEADIHLQRALLTLPGYFRPTKLWDILVIHRGKLVAAIELKSHVGPSFGNNFNNRTEEAIGTSHDLWTAYREGAFGKQAPPFVGWLILVEDHEKSRKPVRDNSPHFEVFEAFKGASYQERYDLLCQKLVQEKLYTAASVLASPREAAEPGSYRELSELTGLRTFLSALAGRVAVEASRTDSSD